MDVDVRVPHQNVVHDHLHHTAGDDSENGQLFLTVGLQNSIGQNHQADEDQSNAQDLQMGTRCQCILRLHRQHEQLNGGGQHGKADACRQRQNSDETEGGGNDAVRLSVVLPGQRRRCEGDQAHGDGINKGGHHVGHIHGDAVLAVQHSRRRF